MCEILELNKTFKTYKSDRSRNSISITSIPSYRSDRSFSSQKVKMSCENQAPLSEDFIIEERLAEERLAQEDEEDFDDGYESRQNKEETARIIEEIVEGITFKRRGTLIRTISRILRY